MLIFGFFDCASEYILIEPTKIEYFLERQQLDCTAIQITYCYNILTKSGNYKFADSENQRRISLIAILIDNQSEDTLHFPDDIIIFTNDYELVPLEFNEVMSALMPQHSSEEEVQFEIKTKKSTHFLDSGLFRVFGSFKTSMKFYKEMKEYYLVNSIILPGSTVSGLLAFPIQKNKPLTFHLVD